MEIVIAVVVVAVIAVFVVGFFSVPGLGTSNRGNDNVEGCAAACANLLAKRAQTCAHRASVAAARTTRDTAAMQFAAAAAASAAAAALVLAAAAGVAAAIAAVYANYLLGRLAGAAAALQIQLDGLSDAVRLEADALTLLTNSCSPEAAASCMNSLPTCPI